MADPVIVPPTPTVTQPPPGVVDTSPGFDQLKSVFDRVLPEVKGQPTPPKSQEPPKPIDTPPAPVTEPQKPATEPPKEPAKESHEVPPSILEQALRGTESAVKPPAEEEWPDELPTFKTPEESKQRYRKWREEYKTLKNELKTLQEKPTLNAQQLARLETLEAQNKQMSEVLTRVGVEHSAEFQNNIMRPLKQNWGEAVRVVSQAGGDPQALAKAMSLSGKAQFEALDELFSEMPESAKIEAHEALRNYRRFEDARRAAIANAPQALEGIRKRELERQYADVNRQRDEMRGTFDRAYDKLKNEAKLEVFQRTDLPDVQWWNDQGERLKKMSADLFLENTDMERVAMACLLAPAADTYRNLWLNSQKKIASLEKLFKDRLGSEPNLSESSGNIGTPPEVSLAEDLKKPFDQVFLREFHRSQARNR